MDEKNENKAYKLKTDSEKERLTVVTLNILAQKKKHKKSDSLADRNINRLKRITNYKKCTH